MHDVCKANFYSMEYRNVKVDGAWVQKPYYAVDEDLPYGHGEKSVYIINGFIKLCILGCIVLFISDFFVPDSLKISIALITRLTSLK